MISYCNNQNHQPVNCKACGAAFCHDCNVISSNRLVSTCPVLNCRAKFYSGVIYSENGKFSQIEGNPIFCANFLSRLSRSWQLAQEEREYVTFDEFVADYLRRAQK